MSNCMELFSANTAEWFTKTFGEPTAVQQEAWPAIAGGRHTLVSAPTGTGKTLSAFLVFLDQLKQQAANGTLREELQVIYISPLKSLAGDIRENLRRPLYGIPEQEGAVKITAAIRTGDTDQKERRHMIKHPPHILITTPESLYLLLTSKSGRTILGTARAVIIDELHAMIDSKRGAHLMLSLARLDKLCGRRLQRIGLSATIEPLPLAAEYLSPDPVAIVAPKIKKEVLLQVTSPLADSGQGMLRDTLWEELADTVYHYCQNSRSVIAFVEGRRYAEKLAYYVNQLGGEGFARTHHGSLSKEQRLEVEQALRDGQLRLLCATSSMELGIDVGDIDQVLQIGCPRTISGTMQRLGRAGHNPGRVSVMHMFPRTAPESLYCGMTAELARRGGVEQAHPPRLCLDVLAQHLVSMAVAKEYSVDEAMEILKRAYPFREVTRDMVKRVLGMLAGDDEHDREIPVRPRLIYDRIHERVYGDTYSRMLAVSAGGTIPDKGMYAVKSREGVKLGELDEEFVFEARIGERFLLGTFAWKIVGQDKDTVLVEQASADGAKLPFWKGELKGGSLRTGMAFGRILRSLGQACEDNTVEEALRELGLDEPACKKTASFLRRQIDATGMLPDDRTIVIERFRDHTGTSQLMVHSMFGRQVNAPLSILVQQEAQRQLDENVGCVDDEGGFMLFPYGEDPLPYGLLQSVDPQKARGILEAVLPSTSLFNMSFRYNAARALMMGVKMRGRQPLWIQRLRSAEMMDSALAKKSHPLVVETTRECLEDQWDLGGVEFVLNGIRAGTISIREIEVELPSPMSLPFQWQMEAAAMYDYSPMPKGVQAHVAEGLKQAEMIAPDKAELIRASARTSLPEDETQLHTLLMTEGDLLIGELCLPGEWFEHLAEGGFAVYRDPGIWIAAEHREEYEKALGGESAVADEERSNRPQSAQGDASNEEIQEARLHILRRMLYYRGPQSAVSAAERYFWTEQTARGLLELLCEKEQAVERDGLYYHVKTYDRARRETVKNLRRAAVTLPGHRYAAFMADRISMLPAKEQLQKTLEEFSGMSFPAAQWESVLLPGRVKEYRGELLDRLLAEGEFFWKISPDGNLAFYRYEDVDWDAPMENPPADLENGPATIYGELVKRGASFMNVLARLPQVEDFQEALLPLVRSGLVTADSFLPVRQWLDREKLKKAPVKQRVGAKVKLQTTGRCDLARPLKALTLEEQIMKAFDRYGILCRETAYAQGLSWGTALEQLRVWEYTGRARRGYFIEGLSGAQYIREKEYNGVMQALESPKEEIRWLPAIDPAQIWGKVLKPLPDCGFMGVAGTAVALYQGRPAAVMERQGKTLRVFDEAHLAEALKAFAAMYKKKQLFGPGAGGGAKRLVIKEYPDCARAALEAAGFLREMQDYTLYR